MSAAFHVHRRSKHPPCHTEDRLTVEREIGAVRRENMNNRGVTDSMTGCPGCPGWAKAERDTRRGARVSCWHRRPAPCSAHRIACERTETRTMTTVPTARPRTRRSRPSRRGRSADAVSVQYLLARARHPWPAHLRRHRRSAAEPGIGLIGVVVLSGWSATLRLLVLLAGPVVALGTVAPEAAGVAVMPLVGSIAWLARRPPAWTWARP